MGVDPAVSYVAAMTRIAALAVVAVFGGTAVARAGPPAPSIPVHFGLTHARPVAGQQYTGVTITRIQDPITFVRCDAHIGGIQLHGRVLRYYAPGVQGPVAVTCSWALPAGTGGRNLRTTVNVLLGNTTTGGVFSWRIVRR